MNLSREFLERCAAETNYPASTIEKVVRLADMSANIARHPLLRRALALKGGTALNLCFGTPTRLSVDLDFNYITTVDREQMLADRPGIEDALTQLASRMGHSVQASADTFAGRKLFLGYMSVFGHNDRIEIDVNYLYRLPLEQTAELELWLPGGLDRYRVPTVSALELWVGKLLAFLDRGAPRDAWDVRRLPTTARGVLEHPHFRPWFLALSATLEHPLETYTFTRLEKRLTERLVREQLTPMLATGEPPNVNDLVREAWAVVEPLMKLAANEKAFFDAIQAGDLRPDLLAGQEQSLVDRIGRHPAILWKIQNVREHKARKTSKRKR